jgi:hypothetical protein
VLDFIKGLIEGDTGGTLQKQGGAEKVKINYPFFLIGILSLYRLSERH